MEKKRVLLIDDEETLTRTLRAYLEGSGPYEVRTAKSGAEGLAIARAFHPDLIFLDIIMPDVDGGEVGAQIRADAELKSTPIVFLTAVVSRNEVNGRNGRPIGGQIFMAKPVSAKEVLECVERYVGGGPAEDAMTRSQLKEPGDGHPKANLSR
jgi:CheY-like chemotaxis protein